MEKPEPHDPMTAEQRSRVEQLTNSEIELIDDALAMQVRERLRKGAMIVGFAMMEPGLPKDVCDLYYFERLLVMVGKGFIELHGYSGNMGFCEVRLRPALQRS